MKTAFGKLMLLAFALAIGMLLLAPMRSGIEDRLIVSVQSVELAPGESVTVSHQLIAESAQTVAYSSDAPGVATVSQQGLITAVSPGDTVIRLTAQGGAAAKIDIRVEGVPVKTFSLNTHLLEMDKGDVSGLSYEFNTGATQQSVSWSSADPEIVTVDAAGRLVAVGAGETYVTATAAGGRSDSALIRVRVRSTSVQIAPEALTVGVGTAFQLEATYLPEDATDSVVKWTSSSPHVLSVDESGMIRAISAGKAKVIVTTQSGLTASASISVEPASKDFLLNPTQITIERGDEYALEACFIGADGQVDKSVNHLIQWSSSAESVATVENGVVKALKTGKTVLSAKADGFEAQCEVTVQTSVKNVHLNVTEQTVYQNQTQEPFQIRASVYPQDADDCSLTYRSNNELVAKVSPKGLVTLTGGCGTAVITVESKSGASVECVVNVLAVGS